VFVLIWRAMKEGALVPTGRKGTHYRFSRTYVNQLKDSARKAGATGWLAAALRRLERRRIPRTVDDAQVKPRPIRPVVPLEPEGDKADLSV
jgi:hypothetical protein